MCMMHPATMDVLEEEEADDFPASALEVPPEFEEVSYDWRVPSGSQIAPSPRQQERLQNCMKPFIQSLLAGILVRLRLEPGEAPDGDPSRQSIDVVVTLSEDLSVLFISSGSAQRRVSVKEVKPV